MSYPVAPKRLRSAKILFLVPALFLAACATPIPTHQALPDTARNAISSTDIVVPIKQSEIYVFVPASNIAAAGGGGLLLALVDAGVDSVRTSKAEAAVKPLRNALVDYKFDDTLCSDISGSLTQVTWVKPGTPRVIKEVTNESLDAALAQSKSDAVLFATMDYHLSNDADILDVMMNASLFANNDALKALGPSKLASPKTSLGNALYRNILTYEMTVPAGTVDRDKNIVIWSADNGAAMRKALDRGAVKLAQMLSADLQGQQLPSDTDGTVERSKDGTLRYVVTPGH